MDVMTATGVVTAAEQCADTSRDKTSDDKTRSQRSQSFRKVKATRNIQNVHC